KTKISIYAHFPASQNFGDVLRLLSSQVKLLRVSGGHLERSEAESKDPVEGPFDFTTGFLPPSHKATARQATWVGMTVCESGELHAEQFALPGHERFFGTALVRRDRLQSST